ncbi:hypothetical protein [Sphingomonas mollis]|uniref:Uncharacterized protein n=1 Tax=Sphingomonas mollis TaxID=2795726 RepID=A0ABS0XSC6_9SPHN|nr:hypothetical protein [Sphingomonas sp. BT553]MBJ6122946.1 hypothetical protein [Sphingomonas sp. BT553]
MNREGAKRMLGGLIQVLVAHGEFTSVNDAYALAWPVMRREHIRRQATLRQQIQRRRNVKTELSNGQIPEVLSMHMEVERQHRSIRFREYAKCKEAPLQIRIDPGGDNARFTADAWLARERRKIRRQSVTAYGIAKELKEIERSYGLGFEVLRDRVNKALKRIEILEAATFRESGERVWDRFDAKIALRDLMVPPPYEAV